jgi:hypothetical protein
MRKKMIDTVSIKLIKAWLNFDQFRNFCKENTSVLPNFRDPENLKTYLQFKFKAFNLLNTHCKTNETTETSCDIVNVLINVLP